MDGLQIKITMKMAALMQIVGSIALAKLDESGDKRKARLITMEPQQPGKIYCAWATAQISPGGVSLDDP